MGICTFAIRGKPSFHTAHTDDVGASAKIVWARQDRLRHLRNPVVPANHSTKTTLAAADVPSRTTLPHKTFS